MDKKREPQKLNLSLCLLLFLILFLHRSLIATQPDPLVDVKLTLENQPKIGGIAILKLNVIGANNLDLERAKISCFLPEDLELINDKNYQFLRKQTLTTREWGNEVTFYSGPMKAKEKKEFIFRVRIPDGKKYRIYPYGGDSLEIDLGDPEPPEWTYDDKKELAGMKDGKYHIKTRIKQLEGNQLIDLTIPKDSLPPLRTELKARTKDRPSFDFQELIYNPRPGKVYFIPVRYLVYTEEEAPQVKVTLTIPQGFEFIKEEPYEVFSLADSRKEVLLYSGPMRFKECKAFYFKVRPVSRQEEFPIIATSQIVTLDGRTLLKEDKLTINLRRKEL